MGSVIGLAAGAALPFVIVGLFGQLLPLPVAPAIHGGEKAIATDAQRIDAYVLLGNAEQEADKIDEARTAYKKYLELAPTGPFARELRAILNNL